MCVSIYTFTSRVLYGSVCPLSPQNRPFVVYSILFNLEVSKKKFFELHTTHIQRQHTNEYVYRRANEIANGAIKPLTRIIPEIAVLK